jgi:hypothetical protein
VRQKQKPRDPGGRKRYINDDYAGRQSRRLMAPLWRYI